MIVNKKIAQRQKSATHGLNLLCKILQKKRGQKVEMQNREYKTGLSTTVTISTICKLDEISRILNLKRADVARRIIEYFIEHNEAEDLN